MGAAAGLGGGSGAVSAPLEDEVDFLDLEVDASHPTPGGSAWTRPGMRYGPYEVVGYASEGSASLILYARHVETQAPAAIKLLRQRYADQPRLRERFRREALAMGRLRHASIVRLLLCGLIQDRPFMVLEWVGGGTLRQVLERFGARGQGLPVPLVVEWAVDLLGGLEVAHGQGFLHRDLKPDNVLLDVEGRVKLGDFGLVKAMEEGPIQPLTSPGMPVGTPLYMAPEQCMGEELDVRADLYALGVTLFELLTGRRPFEAGDLVGLLEAQRQPVRVREWRPEVSPELDHVLRLLLATERELRYGSTEEALEALEALVVQPPREEVREHVAVRVEQEGEAQSFLLRVGQRLLVGQIERAHVRLDDPGVAQKHFELQALPDGLVLNPREGETFVGCWRADHPQRITSPAVVQVGETRLEVQWLVDPPPT